MTRCRRDDWPSHRALRALPGYRLLDGRWGERQDKGEATWMPWMCISHYHVPAGPPPRPGPGHGWKPRLSRPAQCAVRQPRSTAPTNPALACCCGASRSRPRPKRSTAQLISPAAAQSCNRQRALPAAQPFCRLAAMRRPKLGPVPRSAPGPSALACALTAPPLARAVAARTRACARAQATEGFGILTAASVAPIISVLTTDLMKKPAKVGAEAMPASSGGFT